MTEPTEVKIKDGELHWFLTMIFLASSFWLIVNSIDRNTDAVLSDRQPACTNWTTWTPDTYCQTHDCAVSKVPFEPLGKQFGADRNFTVSKMCPDNIFTAQEISADGKMVINFKCE